MIAAIGAVAALGSSIINMSSPNIIWAIANQMQSLVLLVVMNVYIPEGLVNLLVGSSFANFNLDFLPYYKIPMIRNGAEWVDIPLEVTDLNTIGVESKSAIVNNMGIILSLFTVMILHFLMIFVPKFSPGGQTNKFKICYYWFVKKVWKGLTFSIYIRMLIEGFQYLTLTAIYEIKDYNITKLSNKVSFGVACGLMILL